MKLSTTLRIALPRKNNELSRALDDVTRHFLHYHRASYSSCVKRAGGISDELIFLSMWTDHTLLLIILSIFF